VSALSKSLAGSVYRTLVCGDDIFEYLDRHDTKILRDAICYSKLLASQYQLRHDLAPTCGVEIAVATEARCLPDRVAMRQLGIDQIRP
jgi:hypothetical protein